MRWYTWVRYRGPLTWLVALALWAPGCGTDSSTEKPPDRPAAPTDDGGPPQPATPDQTTSEDETAPADQTASQPIDVLDVDLADYEQAIAAHRGQVVLVDFWATWCPPCVKQFPHTVELHHKFGQSGLAVIGMSLDDAADRQAIVDFLTRHKARFTQLRSQYEPEESVEKFQLEGGIPHYKLYDRQGNLVRHFTAAESAEIELAVRRLLTD